MRLQKKQNFDSSASSFFFSDQDHADSFLRPPRPVHCRCVLPCLQAPAQNLCCLPVFCRETASAGASEHVYTCQTLWRAPGRGTVTRAGALSTALVGTAAAASASANHILVKDEAKCLELKAAIEASGDVMAKFTELAKEHS